MINGTGDMQSVSAYSYVLTLSTGHFKEFISLGEVWA
jgi:hypothetical protein